MYIYIQHVWLGVLNTDSPDNRQRDCLRREFLFCFLIYLFYPWNVLWYCSVLVCIEHSNCAYTEFLEIDATN